MKSGRRNFGMILAIAVLFATLAFVSVGCASATTYTVCLSGCNYSSIQAAINATNAGDTIEVRSGTYYENVNVTRQLILRGVDTGGGKPVVDAGRNGSAITLSANGITLVGFTATNASGGQAAGITVTSSNNTITGTTACNNKYLATGIYLKYSSNNTITNNNASNNDHGIRLRYSFNNTIAGNNASDNDDYYGIYPYYSVGNTITNNTASNNKCGIYLRYADNNTITNNTANNSADHGIYLYASDSNIITGNTASNNEKGIYLSQASVGNKIYLNNFVNNDRNAYSTYTSINIWNSTEPMTYQYNGSEYTNYLGNYWDDYTGSDGDGNGIGDTSYPIDSDDDNYPLMELFENYVPPENQPPTAKFTCVPPNPAINETVTFNASESYDLDGFISQYEFEFGDGTNGTGEVLTHAYSSVGEYIVNLTVTDDEGATNRTSQVITVFPDVPYFDTELGTYPSICGIHNGTITMTHTVNVSKISTYPCTGTGGHIEYAKIWNSSWEGAEAHWVGYSSDWHNCSFDKNFTLVAGAIYNYTIRTGSYPQIIHEKSKDVTGGAITCTEFIDANGKKYDNWIPAIRLE